MLPVAKNRQANELRAQAQQLRDKLADPAVTMNKTEVEEHAANISALEQRAQMIVGFTPEKEIDAQGGDAELRALAGPEQGDSAEEASQAFAPRYEKLCKQVRAAFGTTSQYLRVMTGAQEPTEKQKGLIREVKELTRAAIVGTASDASGGEFLLPLQQVNEIFKVSNVQAGVLERARRYPVNGRTLRIPYVKQSDATLARPMAGIAAVGIIGENASITEAEPVFAQRLLTVFKYAAITKLSDEILDDDLTGQLAPTVLDQIGQEILNQMNYDMTILGGGTTNSVGALHTSANAALLKVVRTTVSVVSVTDIFNMYQKHTHGPNSYWQISRSSLRGIMSLTLSGNTLVTYLANLNNNPSGLMLLGYPVVISDFNNTYGTESDVALINPDFYAAALRKQLTVESSIHVDFAKAVTTYRLIARAGGIPIPDGPYAYRAAGSALIDSHSPFVTLDDLYVS